MTRQTVRKFFGKTKTDELKRVKQGRETLWDCLRKTDYLMNEKVQFNFTREVTLLKVLSFLLLILLMLNYSMDRQMD